MILLIDKPKGFTSFQVVRKLKRIFPKTKIGHSGTLDPMATGLLIIGIGRSTKMLHEFQQLDKVYTTTIDLSKDSDTWDMDFWEYFQQYEYDDKQISIGDNKIDIPRLEDIKNILDSIIGEVEMPLPDFSAKRMGGKRLYDLARQGKQMNQFRTMKIYSYEILDYKFPEVKLKINVGSGTYIRSIGHYLGQRLGTAGILTQLCRDSVGDFKLD